MNQGITRLSEKYNKIRLMENYFGLFCDSNGLLAAHLGKFWQGRPNNKDDLHLGRNGIRLFARCIKHTILKRKGSVSSFGSSYNVNNIDTSTSRNKDRNRLNNNIDVHPSGSQSYFDCRYSRAVTHPYSHYDDY